MAVPGTHTCGPLYLPAGGPGPLHLELDHDGLHNGPSLPNLHPTGGFLSSSNYTPGKDTLSLSTSWGALDLLT
jgi:hypothetical protein